MTLHEPAVPRRLPAADVDEVLEALNRVESLHGPLSTPSDPSVTLPLYIEAAARSRQRTTTDDDDAGADVRSTGRSIDVLTAETGMRPSDRNDGNYRQTGWQLSDPVTPDTDVEPGFYPRSMWEHCQTETIDKITKVNRAPTPPLSARFNEYRDIIRWDERRTQPAQSVLRQLQETVQQQTGVATSSTKGGRDGAV